MRKYLPGVFFLFLLTFLLIYPPEVSAQKTASYYDWSSTVEYQQKAVLGIVYAQESTASAKQSNTPANYLQFNRYLFGGDLTPNSSFYFLKPLQENIQLALTFDKQAKNKLRVRIAGERLDEMQKLAGSKNAAAIATAANSYQQTMSTVSDDVALLKKQNVNEDDLIKQLEDETAKHDVILEQVRVQAPNQAEAALDKALEASWRGTDTVADLKNRPAVPPDVVSRLQSLKSQGLLTPEEVNKLISIKTRAEARTEIGKYVNQGIVPPSDFMRLNETVKSFYPEDFYKLHETLRFQEMQKLESEKPDNATLEKIQAFAKSYKPGEQVPPELRRYWAPVVRLEEIQNTLRPDLIDANLFKQNEEESKKFNEVVERFKPRPEDVAFVKNFIQKNNADVNNLPPEYQRMYGLAQKYGAQCGAGFNWVPESQNPAGGYCAPNGANSSNLPRFNDFAKGKLCNGSIVSAKGSGGACSAYPADCIPPGWSRTESCVATPTTQVGQGSTVNSQRINCPSNAHFVSVSYDPNGGYCIPNYTQVGFDQSTGAADFACPAGYHRSYSGGGCIPDYNTSFVNNSVYSLPPLTTTPGGAYYTNSGKCGQSAHWVPEPINPNGGYCVGDNYQSPNQNTLPGTNGVPKVDMGNCRTPGECYDFCRSNPNAASCSGFNPSQPRPGDAGSRESQEAACRSSGGTCSSWNNGTCGCTGSTGGINSTPYGTPSRESQEAACRSGGGTCEGWFNGACSCIHKNSSGGGPFQCQLYCPPPSYLDYASCSCKNTPTSGSSTPKSADPSGGCSNYSPGMCGGSGGYFDFGSCSCKMNSYTPSSGGSTPPSGYGSCGSGLYWNGSACVSNSPSSSGTPPPPPSGSTPPASSTPAPAPQPATQPTAPASEAPAPQPATQPTAPASEAPAPQPSTSP